MSRRRTRAALLAKCLALAILAVLPDVGRGQSGSPCAALEGVNLSPNPAVPSVFRTEFNPGRFNTMNYDSPDTTIRWVLEYSEEEDFSNLPPLSLNRSMFDKTADISRGGVDLDFILDNRGKVKAGRFVFTKLTPNDQFNFPIAKQLENGVMYYFKNYKVRDGCVSPPLNTHAIYPSEVLTRPSILQSQGFPSAVRGLEHVQVFSDRIELQWVLPLDSGNNKTTYTAGSIAVGYMVKLVPQKGSDNSVKAGAVTKEVSVTSERVVVQVLQGQLYQFRIKVNNSMGFSEERTLLGRAVSPPQNPRNLTFQINPFNLTNATGNRNGSLSWNEPFDTGLGVRCGPSTRWTSCQQYPLLVNRYKLRRVYGPGAEPPSTSVNLDLAVQPSNEKQINVSYDKQYYKFRVAAGNQQEAVLGNFSALGQEEDTTQNPNGVLAGPPLSMRLLYSPWATNVTGAGVGVSQEILVDPTQGRGISDYCFTSNNNDTSVVAGSKCPADDADVDVYWMPPSECERCKDPELSVFVDSVYTFRLRAVKDFDYDFAEFDPDDIRIENNLPELLGHNWQSIVSLNYTVFRCSAKSPDQHWSDQEACDTVNATNSRGGQTRDVDGYGWKEVVVSITATKDMASRGLNSRICFTAIAPPPSNKRSLMCVDVRVIRPDPQFSEFTLNHKVTMGCRFSTDVTAQDRTELVLSRETALEKNYLVGISSSGGRIESLYRSTPFPALPTGARLFPKGLTMATNNSITYRFEWTPKRFQEGFRYVVHLEARGFLGDTPVAGVTGSPLREISLVLDVLRCRFCTETADEISLSNLASEWRASWLSIWSGNHVLVDADTVEDTTVELGPVLKVASTQACNRATLGDLCNDDLAHIGSRYGVSVQDLLWWNPDLSDEAGRKNNYQLYENQEICVLPNTCVNTGHIYSGGY
mmetsp:Transcript_49411/g.72480  ORF Transcript_49411/g.72480 Transcript_49411/m.72480 type:complete len:922 (-) Transcript_49411:1602-4367(-)